MEVWCVVAPYIRHAHTIHRTIPFSLPTAAISRTQGLGKYGSYNSEDLVRQAKSYGDDYGGIEATDSTSQAAVARWQILPI